MSAQLHAALRDARPATLVPCGPGGRERARLYVAGASRVAFELHSLPPPPDAKTTRRRASAEEETCVYPAIASLSVILHIGVGVLLPSVKAGVHEAFESQIVLEAPPPPPPPPPPAEPEPPLAAATPPPRAVRVAAPKPTVLEESTSAGDVKIDAVVGETATMPATPPPPEPAPVAVAPAPAPAPPPAPRVESGPVIVPAKSLGRMPRAPALDRELERNYPAEARRAGVSGSATLRLQVLSDGQLGRVQHLSESHAGFGAACERTVRAARWDPPLDRDGKAVATEIKYVCKFEVRS